MNLKALHVIYFDSKEIKKNDILWGLLGLGIDVYGSKIQVDINFPDEDQIMAIIGEVQNYDYAVTQNFSVNVAIACHIAQVKYISWVYDAPQVALYTDHALYDENFIFCFDKKQTERMRSRGIKHVYHQPLAANIQYMNTLKLNASRNPQYRSDISFIGQLYNVPLLHSLFDIITAEEKQALELELQKYMFKWSPDINIYEGNNEFALQMSKYISGSDFNYFKTDPAFMFKSMIYSPFLAKEERMRLLSEAASEHNTTLYTTDRDYELASGISHLTVRHSVKEDIPYRIYNASKLNLNLTIRSIETAAPQRIFDIMGAGGAVISDYRPEMAELFIPDKEIILFESIEEFREKADFYLERDAKRAEIARNGQRRVAKEYNYTVSLSNMFEKCHNESII